MNAAQVVITANPAYMLAQPYNYICAPAYHYKCVRTCEHTDHADRAALL